MLQMLRSESTCGVQGMSWPKKRWRSASAKQRQRQRGAPLARQPGSLALLGFTSEEFLCANRKGASGEDVHWIAADASNPSLCCTVL